MRPTRTVMQRAERAFQEGRYEEAIKGYEEARSMRPYNVYPKVKIEDLRALLARQTHQAGHRLNGRRPSRGQLTPWYR